MNCSFCLDSRLRKTHFCLTKYVLVNRTFFYSAILYFFLFEKKLTVCLCTTILSYISLCKAPFFLKDCLCETHFFFIMC